MVGGRKLVEPALEDSSARAWGDDEVVEQHPALAAQAANEVAASIGASPYELDRCAPRSWASPSPS